jgi:hypothetical protein
MLILSASLNTSQLNFQDSINKCNFKLSLNPSSLLHKNGLKLFNFQYDIKYDETDDSKMFYSSLNEQN